MNDEMCVNLTIEQARELLVFLEALANAWRDDKRYSDADDVMLFAHDIEVALREAGE